MITAHAGCDGTPDNSMEYLLHAMELPVDALEVDLRKNEKGDLVLSHDPGSGPAVSLADAFTLLCAHPEKKMNCDLKVSGLEQDVAQLARKCGVGDRLIFTGTVNPELFRKGKSAFPQVAWFANLELFHPEAENWKEPGFRTEAATEAFSKMVLQLKQYETAGINLNFRAAEKIWEKAGEMGIGLSLWTVNEEEDLRVWLRRGVRNITSRNITGILNLQKYERKQRKDESIGHNPAGK